MPKSHLVIDSAGKQKRAKHEVWDRTKQMADAAVKRDWENNLITYAPDGDRPTTLLLAQVGRYLTRQQVELRLKACNPNLWVEPTNGNLAGVFIVSREPDNLGVVGPKKKFLTGMMAGYSPEFTVNHTVPEQVPNPNSPGEMITRQRYVGETRGWRKVLVALMKHGLINLEDATKHFEITKGQQSKNWHLLTT